MEHLDPTAVPATTRYARPAADELPLGVRVFDRTLDLAWRRTSYSALTAAADQQDTGLKAELAAHLLTWGQDHGAEKAWLEIEASDSTGVQLAEGLGFLEQHRHRFARRRGQVT